MQEEELKVRECKSEIEQLQEQVEKLNRQLERLETSNTTVAITINDNLANIKRYPDYKREEAIVLIEQRAVEASQKMLLNKKLAQKLSHGLKLEKDQRITECLDEESFSHDSSELPRFGTTYVGGKK